MKVGDKVEVVVDTGDMLESWVKTGMVGTVKRIYDMGTYRYHVVFETGWSEDLSEAEIKPVQNLSTYS